MKPFFSIVIPLYNKEKYIEETINSVINQTFNDFEVIIVNDGSTDSSLEIAKSFTDKKFKILSQDNKGLSAARNTGIRNAKADYIAFLDADDLWNKDFLETIHKLILNFSSCSLFTTAFQTFIKNKKAISNITKFDIEATKIISNYTELSKVLVIIGAMVVNKKVFERAGLFNEHINYAEDEDFYIRVFLNKDFSLVYYDTPKAFYRANVKDQLTSPNPNFKRIIPDFDHYLTKKNKNDLKLYLDKIHYKLVVLYKMELNHERVKFYKQKINTSNLNIVQKIKFHLPVKVFYYFKLLYLFLKN